ncbi:MAG: hypothetical protein LBU12_00515, partial [Deltaproteobacteria bacterium]|nr:hypothetical protein [Deltaproteobacteria bacterium]
MKPLKKPPKTPQAADQAAGQATGQATGQAADQAAGQTPPQTPPNHRPNVKPGQKAGKRRADELAVELGLAATRSQARALIMAGRLAAPDGARLLKAGELLPAETALTLTPGRLYVSRAGIKLAGALDDLGLDPAGLNCLDLGASTGGFSDCLLQRGADRVTAVDVGRGLLDYGLRRHPRLKV